MKVSLQEAVVDKSYKCGYKDKYGSEKNLLVVLFYIIHRKTQFYNLVNFTILKTFKIHKIRII